MKINLWNKMVIVNKTKRNDEVFSFQICESKVATKWYNNQKTHIVLLITSNIGTYTLIYNKKIRNP